MSRYYLNPEVDGQFVEDPEGAEFPNIGAARGAAIKTAREIISNRVVQGKRASDGRIVVTDDASGVVAEAFFDDVASGK